MLLTDLVKQDNTPSVVWGIEIDELVMIPMKGITSIGFMAKFQDGRLSNDVLDIAIMYSLAGAEVVIEVPANSVFSMDGIFSDAANGDFVLSFLPPQNEDAKEWNEYKSRLSEACQYFLTRQNISKDVLPVSSYYQYLVQELFGHMPQNMASDEYMNARFVEGWAESVMDDTKAFLRDQIIDAEGGEEAFYNKVHSILYAVTDKMDAMSTGK